MLGILIATHGDLSIGLLDAAKLIVGKQENIRTMSLFHDTDISTFGDIMKENIEELNQGQGVIVFVDLFAASPYNQAVLKKQELKDTPYKIISGVNLPMLIECLSLRMTEAEAPAEKVWERLLEAGKFGIKEFEQEFLAYNEK